VRGRGGGCFDWEGGCYVQPSAASLLMARLWDTFEEVEVASWRAEGPGLSGPHGADLGSRLRAVDFRMLIGPD
jgi:hypothetical protein